MKPIRAGIRLPIFLALGACSESLYLTVPEAAKPASGYTFIAPYVTEVQEPDRCRPDGGGAGKAG